MDKREFTVIDNKTKIEKATPEKLLHTNPIAKKFHQFHTEKIAKFSVKDIFKP